MNRSRHAFAQVVCPISEVILSSMIECHIQSQRECLLALDFVRWKTGDVIFIAKQSHLDECVAMHSIALQDALSDIHPMTSEGADALLDLRDLLMSDGHPGTCVKCFFTLLGDLGKTGALRPLKRLLEERFEVEVSAECGELETMTLNLDAGSDLESFCMHAMEIVRYDRAYRERQIMLRLRRKKIASS